MRSLSKSFEKIVDKGGQKDNQRGKALLLQQLKDRRLSEDLFTTPVDEKTNLRLLWTMFEAIVEYSQNNTEAMADYAKVACLILPDLVEILIGRLDEVAIEPKNTTPWSKPEFNARTQAVAHARLNALEGGWLADSGARFSDLNDQATKLLPKLL